MFRQTKTMKTLQLQYATKHPLLRRGLGGLLLTLLLFSFCPAGAQSFTQRLQKRVKGEGTVTIHQDKEIEILINGTLQEAATKTPTQASAQTAKKTDNKTAAAGSNQESSNANNNRHQQQQDDTLTQTRPLVADTIVRTGRTRHVMGWRVQVYSGGNSRSDRVKAERMGSQVKAMFPELQVYVKFRSPRWLCRVGNFRDYAEASKIKNDIKQMGFESATVVKDSIVVPY